MLFCHNTSRVEGDAYPNLLREKGGAGFPMLAFMDEDGDVLVKQTERTPSGFLRTLARLEPPFVKARQLARKAAAGDKAAAAELVVLEIERGKHDFETAKNKIVEANLSDAQRQRLTPALLDLEVGVDLQKLPKDTHDPTRDELMVDVAKKFRVMRNEHRIPTGARAREFWGTLLGAARVERNPKLYAETLVDAKKALAGDKNATMTIKLWEQELEALQGR